MSRNIVIALTLGLMATVASAGITGMEVVQVDNSSVAALAPYTTQDIKIDFTGQVTGFQLIINLTQGSIYQDAAGSAVAPTAMFVGFVPSLAYDTFVAFGGPTDDTKAGAYALGGGAVDLGGAAGAVFTTAAINQAWNAAPGVIVNSGEDFTIARISLSDDAQGSWKLLASAGGEISKYESSDYQIVDGQLIVVPEPATLSVLALGGLALIRRRR